LQRRTYGVTEMDEVLVPKRQSADTLPRGRLTAFAWLRGFRQCVVDSAASADLASAPDRDLEIAGGLGRLGDILPFSASGRLGTESVNRLGGSARTVVEQP
jgi:hypothetical protein